MLSLVAKQFADCFREISSSFACAHAVKKVGVVFSDTDCFDDVRAVEYPLSFALFGHTFGSCDNKRLTASQITDSGVWLCQKCVLNEVLWQTLHTRHC